MKELINMLAHKLANLEDNDGKIVLYSEEFKINEAIIFVSGSIDYSYDDAVGDYFTPSTSTRNFLGADLEVSVYFDENDVNGSDLTKDELELLYKSLN